MRISVAGVAEKRGRFLVALRKPGTSIGVRWEFPGGKLEAGEGPEEALKREYIEELGVGIKVKDKLCEGYFKNGLKKYKLQAYSIELESEHFNNKEHDRIEWVALSELSRLEFPGSDEIIVNYLLSR
jgi:8-oxo-dGTP diphosphatase